MTPAVEVTVVIPTRNRWNLLSRKALRGALFQEGVDHEVIVVDDGSTDETSARLRSLDESRLRVIRHETPGGAAQARNAGIREARGEWIAFLDDDDAWAPTKLRLQLDAVRAVGADFAYSGVVTVDDSGAVLYQSPPPPPGRLRYDTIAMSAIPAGSSNVLVRASLVRGLGGFDERMLNMEDWDLWIRLASAGEAVALPEVLVACLQHSAGKALTSPRVAFARLGYLERKHRALRAERGVDPDRVAFAHYVAWLQLRRRRYGSASVVYLCSAFRNRRPRDTIPAARFALRAMLPMWRPARSDASDVPGPDWLDLYGS